MPEGDKETAAPSTCEILQITSSLEEGQSAKIGTLGFKWKVATAIKAKRCFMLNLTKKVKKLFLIHLMLKTALCWKQIYGKYLGWYTFLGTPAPHTTAGQGSQQL